MKITYKELIQTPVKQLLAYNSKYKVSIYVDVDLKTNRVKYLFISENGIETVDYLQDACKLFKKAIEPKLSVDWKGSAKPVNAFSFNDAIYNQKLIIGS